jgi:hypothetical protein
MMPNLRPVDQLAMDETTIEDAGLESALEEREARKAAYSDVRKAYDEANVVALGEIEKLELPTGSVARVGRFRISRQDIPAGHREFDTKASSRISIRLAEDE